MLARPRYACNVHRSVQRFRSSPRDFRISIRPRRYIARLLHKQLSTNSSSHPSHQRQVSAEPATSLQSTARIRRKDRQHNDIVPGNLQATLDAHRASNRDPARLAYRPLYVGDAGSSPKLVPERPHNVYRPSGLSKLSSSRNTPLNGNSKKKKEPPDANVRKQVNHARYAPDGKSQRNSAERPIEQPGDRAQHSYWPWSNKLLSRNSDRYESLNKELEALASWMTLTPQELRLRDKWAVGLIQEIQYKVPGISFHRFGSSTFGLSTSASDIDIGFTVNSIEAKAGKRGPSSSMGRPQIRRVVNGHIRKVTEHIGRGNQWSKLKIVRSAHRPLIQIQHRFSHMDVQIVYNDEKLPRSESIQNYNSEYPQLKPIFFVIKAALESQGWMARQWGGFGSYPLLMFVLASFKHRKISRRDDLQHCLIEFLDFAANLNTTIECISVDPPKTFEKKQAFVVESTEAKEKQKADMEAYAEHRLSILDPSQPWLLCLQDPLDSLNDLGRNCHKFREIQRVFRAFLDRLRAWLDGDSRSTDIPSEAKRGELSPLHEFLKLHVQEIHDRRRKFELWASNQRGDSSTSP